MTLTVEALSATENVITWSGSSNNGRGFRLERSLSGTSEWDPIAAIGPDTTEYIDSGLRPDTLYFYRLRTSQTDTSNVVSTRTKSQIETEPPAETPLATPTSLQGDMNEGISQPDPSPDQEQPANITLNGQKWLIVLVAAVLFVALVSVGLLVVRTKQPPLE
jgi:hypothetical protein